MDAESAGKGQDFVQKKFWFLFPVFAVLTNDVSAGFTCIKQSRRGLNLILESIGSCLMVIKVFYPLSHVLGHRPVIVRVHRGTF